MIPAGNNVYGVLKPPVKLKVVLAGATSVHQWGKAHIYVSGYDGARTIHLRSESADFDSNPIGSGEHLFNGAVGGTPDEVIAFVKRLSEAFTERGVAHQLEVYDADRQLVAEFPMDE